MSEMKTHLQIELEKLEKEIEETNPLKKDCFIHDDCYDNDEITYQFKEVYNILNKLCSIVKESEKSKVSQ